MVDADLGDGEARLSTPSPTADLHGIRHGSTSRLRRLGPSRIVKGVRPGREGATSLGMVSGTSPLGGIAGGRPAVALPRLQPDAEAHPAVSTRPSDRAVLMVGDMPKPLGGVSLYCYHVCAELSRRGVDVHFADSEPGDEKILPALASYRRVTGRYGRGTLEALGSPAVLHSWAALTGPIATDIGPRAGLQVLVIAARVHSVARRGGPEHILAHHAGVRGLAAVVAGRTLGIPVTLLVHGAEWGSPKWNRRLAAVVAQRADRVIANSDYTRQLCRSGSGRADVEVAFPGVDHERFRPGRDPADGATSSRWCCSSGRCTGGRAPTSWPGRSPC